MTAVQIVDLKPSTRAHKRYKAILNNGKAIDFGLDTGSTYVDHGNFELRSAYRKRHYGSMREKPLIENLVPSPSLLAFYVLWGPHETVEQNIQYLNRLWIKKRVTG